jgi:hypothetical protein
VRLPWRTLFAPVEAIGGHPARLRRGTPVRLFLIAAPDGRRVDVVRGVAA